VTQDAPRLVTLMEKFDAAALVVGLPLNMDGSEGPSAQAARAFARNFGPLSARALACFGMNGFRPWPSPVRCARVVDRMAAAFILRGELDRLRRILA
jgi:putative Holliday junction resolvase